MKQTWNFIKNLIIILYILVIIFVTICLLSFNSYRVAVIGDTAILPVVDEGLPYNKGDLLLVNKGNPAKVKIGNKVLFYRQFAGETSVNYAEVTNVEQITDTETTITVSMEGKPHMFSGDDLMGSESNVDVIPKVGSIVNLLESKWGFLFLGVFPSLLAFLYTLYSIALEIKENKEREEEERRKAARKKKKKKLEEKKRKEAERAKLEQVDDDDDEDDDEEDDETVEEKVETKKEIKAEKKEKEKEPEEIEEKEETKEEKAEEIVEEKVEEKTEEKTEEEPKEVKEEIKEEVKVEPQKEENTEKNKKEMIEEKMKSLTEEQKRALIEAKLKSMTPEQKKALLEAKKKKMEGNNN